MKFSVFTASTPEWTPREAAVTLAAQGWDGIEWRVIDQVPAEPPGFWAGNLATWPLTGLADSVDEIARVTREAGLEFSGLGGYAPVFDAEGAEALLAATARLGARQVRVTMPAVPTPDYPTLFSEARAALEGVVERARHHGVRALVELHHKTITPSASAALRLVDGLDPAHVGVIHDIGNLVYEGYEHPLAGLQLLGPYLAHVHVKNAGWVRTGADRVDGTAAWDVEWMPLGAGQADIGVLFESLATIGYDEWVTLEDFSTELPLEERTASNLAFVRAAHERAIVAASA